MRSSLKVINCMVTLKCNSLPVKRILEATFLILISSTVDGQFSSPTAFAWICCLCFWSIEDISTHSETPSSLIEVDNEVSKN